MEPLRALWNHLDKIIRKLEIDLDRVDWLYRLTKSVKAKRQLRAKLCNASRRLIIAVQERELVEEMLRVTPSQRLSNREWPCFRNN